MGRRIVGCFVIVVALLVSSLASIAPAQAAFPGHDGRILFRSEIRCCNILSMRPDGTGVRELTHFPAPLLTLQPSYSPDGGHIVFRLDDPGHGTPSQLWVMNADGSHEHRLLPHSTSIDSVPSYAPDGQRVIFSRCRPNFTACALFRVGVHGTDLTQVTAFKPGVLDLGPVYSPDGRVIAFTGVNRNGIPGAIYLLDVRNRTTRRLTPARLEGFNPDWSPAGTGLIFVGHCCSGGHTAIWHIDVDRGRLTQLTHPGGGQDLEPKYSPTGTRIVFAHAGKNPPHLGVYVMNADGSTQQLIRDRQSGPWTWAPAR